LASIERTAYPRFKRHPRARELRDVYTPTDEELDLITNAATHGAASVLSLAVLLNTFQRLGYFPQLADIPSVVVTHIRCASATPLRSPSTSRRGRSTGITRRCVITSAFSPGARRRGTWRRPPCIAPPRVMDNPADLINVAIEKLVRQRFELPAFSGLNRLAGRVRALVNGRLFAGVLERLTAEQRTSLDALLEPLPGERRTAYNDLKELPKRPTVAHLEWLEGLGDVASRHS
jgi:hypothetical protein